MSILNLNDGYIQTQAFTDLFNDLRTYGYSITEVDEIISNLSTNSYICLIEFLNVINDSEKMTELCDELFGHLNREIDLMVERKSLIRPLNSYDDLKNILALLTRKEIVTFSKFLNYLNYLYSTNFKIDSNEREIICGFTESLKELLLSFDYTTALDILYLNILFINYENNQI